MIDEQRRQQKALMEAKKELVTKQKKTLNNNF